MSTPVKPLSLVKKHLTIAEKKARMRKEADLTTGSAIQEWAEVRDNMIAHKRFTKTKNLLASIGKDDALLEPVINRYCLIMSECYECENEDKRLHDMAEKLEDRESDMEFSDYIKAAMAITKAISSNQFGLQSKRKMLLDIEKESGMTLLSQLRTTTKKIKDEKQDDSGAMFG